MPIHGYPGNVITANPTTPSVSSASGVWTTEQQLVNQAAGRWPMAQTQVSRSLRFNSADSAYLNRTPGSAGNRKTWTWNGWVKRSGSGSRLFCSGDQAVSLLRSFLLFGDNITFIDVNASNTTLAYVDSVAVFRDYSAWYCVTLVIDTTQATGSNRIKLYVNGVQQTLTFSTTPSQNADLAMNAASRMTLGTAYDTSSFLDCYLTEVNFIDGLALDPSYFGFNDSNTGVWTPRQYTGAYGTNGFYVNFSDNSNTTAATLGKDYSGNGNNFTPNNFSVTAGSGNDSLVDSPTSYGTDTGAGGEVRGNYATLNPIEAPSASVISNGNLQVVLAATGANQTPSTISVTSGKWYSEFTFSATASGNAVAVGVGPANAYQANLFNVGVVYNAFDGEKYVLGVNTPYGATWTTGDIIGIALDVDGGTITFYKNNTSQGAITLPASAFGWKFGIINGGGSSTKTIIANFGQRAFAYTAPSGFKALCTQNLPTPTIGATSTTQANDYFNAVTYTGNGSSQSVTGVGFQPDLVWIKNRATNNSNRLIDAVRGATKELYSDFTSAEYTEAQSLTSFNSDGFSVGNIQGVNGSGNGLISWNWKANGAGSSNTAGTITSTVSANTTSGFSVVTYTGTGANATVGHGLGVAPSMVIIKRRDTTGTWRVGHSSLTSWAYRLNLNETADAAINAGAFNSTAPTSTVFSVGTDTSTNASTGTYVAYCFAPVAGYSAFGSYTGNGSTDGPFVYLGFRPRFIFGKDSGGTNNWWIFDSARDTYNVAGKILRPNLSDAELDSPPRVDLLSNGFKIRSVNLPNDATTYIYAAFAESPFKYALAR